MLFKFIVATILFSASVSWGTDVPESCHCRIGSGCDKLQQLICRGYTSQNECLADADCDWRRPSGRHLSFLETSYDRPNVNKSANDSGVLAAKAAVFPDGIYSGEGVATNAQGTSFTYKVELVISKLKWKYTYFYPGNRVVVYEMDDVGQGHGFYKMISNGVEVGSGFCGVAQCRLKLELPVGKQIVKVDVTSHFLNDVMYTLGENATTGFYFEETLKRKDL